MEKGRKGGHSIDSARKRSTETGILVQENEKLQKLPDEDAILIVCFGTTKPQARKADLENIIDKIKDSFGEIKVAAAFTSHIVIRRIKEKEGIVYHTPEEALELLADEGYTRVAMVTLDIIPGIEYAYKRQVFRQYRPKFKKMALATPLLYWMGQCGQNDDIKEVFSALLKELKDKIKNYDGILIFAHGTKHPANAYYSVMQERLRQLYGDKAYVYTAEGYPDLEAVMPKLKASGCRRILLLPFLIVAGDHVLNDMAGKDKESHQNILKKNDFEADAYLHGLGESKAIGKFFLKRTQQTYDKLIL